MNFEDYLRDVHMEENPTVLDDDLPDHYEEWVDSLSQIEYRKLENEYKSMKDYLNK